MVISAEELGDSEAAVPGMAVGSRQDADSSSSQTQSWSPCGHSEAAVRGGKTCSAALISKQRLSQAAACWIQDSNLFQKPHQHMRVVAG